MILFCEKQVAHGGRWLLVRMMPMNYATAALACSVGAPKGGAHSSVIVKREKRSIAV